MATGGGILGVLRAARPVFRNHHDRLAYAVHAAFLSAGYSLVATGSRAASHAPEGKNSVEVGDDGWNDMEGAYVFHYSGSGQGDLCKSVLVKCIVVEDSLMVDAARLGEGGNKEPLHLDILVSNYATDTEGTNYGDLYKNLKNLADEVNSNLLGKLVSADEMPRTARSEDETNVETSKCFGPGVREESPPSLPGYTCPTVLSIGSSDLLPGPAAGVYPSSAVRRGGGMLLGPNDPTWGNVGVGHGDGTGFDEGSSMLPPGARYDPIGPPGVPGFEPQRFVRVRRPPGGGGGINPDLEHFQPW